MWKRKRLKKMHADMGRCESYEPAGRTARRSTFDFSAGVASAPYVSAPWPRQATGQTRQAHELGAAVVTYPSSLRMALGAILYRPSGPS